MLLRVYAQSRGDFNKWVAQQQKPPKLDPFTRIGQAAFLRNACVSCHTIAGASATGRFGPDLTHVASRDTIASGAVLNTPENLKKWIDNPAHMKPGSLMPAMHLNDRDLDSITAYLSTLY
jgi:cytochrome c oxidase subunit 2